MKSNPQDPKNFSRLTLEHYNQCAEEFWKGTRYHDVSQNIEGLLRHIEGEPPFTILDFGCGPGRDLKAFVERGHNAIGLEGAEHFVTMARAHSGCDVWHQDFLQLELPEQYFDGVFANAALFHVPKQELPRVLLELYATLRPGGVLFSPNPRGDNVEGWKSGRYCVFHDLEIWRGYVAGAGFI
jgi:SAM-dependent methyltransferase